MLEDRGTSPLHFACNDDTTTSSEEADVMMNESSQETQTQKTPQYPLPLDVASSALSLVELLHSSSADNSFRWESVTNTSSLVLGDVMKRTSAPPSTATSSAKVKSTNENDYDLSTNTLVERIRIPMGLSPAECATNTSDNLQDNVERLLESLAKLSAGNVEASTVATETVTIYRATRVLENVSPKEVWSVIQSPNARREWDTTLSLPQPTRYPNINLHTVHSSWPLGDRVAITTSLKTALSSEDMSPQAETPSSPATFVSLVTSLPVPPETLHLPKPTAHIHLLAHTITSCDPYTSSHPLPSTRLCVYLAIDLPTVIPLVGSWTESSMLHKQIDGIAQFLKDIGVPPRASGGGREVACKDGYGFVFNSSDGDEFGNGEEEKENELTSLENEQLDEMEIVLDLGMWKRGVTGGYAIETMSLETPYTIRVTSIPDRHFVGSPCERHAVTIARKSPTRKQQSVGNSLQGKDEKQKSDVVVRKLKKSEIKTDEFVVLFNGVQVVVETDADSRPASPTPSLLTAPAASRAVTPLSVLHRRSSSDLNRTPPSTQKSNVRISDETLSPNGKTNASSTFSDPLNASLPPLPIRNASPTASVISVRTTFAPHQRKARRHVKIQANLSTERRYSVLALWSVFVLSAIVGTVLRVCVIDYTSPNQNLTWKDYYDEGSIWRLGSWRSLGRCLAMIDCSAPAPKVKSLNVVPPKHLMVCSEICSRRLANEHVDRDVSLKTGDSTTEEAQLDTDTPLGYGEAMSILEIWKTALERWVAGWYHFIDRVGTD